MSPNRPPSGDPYVQKDVHVEVAGIEPASFNTKTRLLRAQPVAIFSAPAISQASRRRAQSLFVFPLDPVTGSVG